MPTGGQGGLELLQVTDPAGERRWTWVPYYQRALWQVAVEQAG